MYTESYSSVSIEMVYLIHKTRIFNKQKKLVIQNFDDFIYHNFQILKEFKNYVDILETEILLKVILKQVNQYNNFVIINGKFNGFEKEFFVNVKCEFF